VLIPVPLADTLLRMAEAPSSFLRGTYGLGAGLFAVKLRDQAGTIGVSLPRLLSSLSKNVPGFVEYFRKQQGVVLT
jgi:hypothetical protein